MSAWQPVLPSSRTPDPILMKKVHQRQEMGTAWVWSWPFPGSRIHPIPSPPLPFTPPLTTCAWCSAVGPSCLAAVLTMALACFSPPLFALRPLSPMKPTLGAQVSRSLGAQVSPWPLLSIVNPYWLILPMAIHYDTLVCIITLIIYMGVSFKNAPPDHPKIIIFSNKQSILGGSVFWEIIGFNLASHESDRLWLLCIIHN